MRLIQQIKLLYKYWILFLGSKAEHYIIIERFKFFFSHFAMFKFLIFFFKIYNNPVPYFELLVRFTNFIDQNTRLTIFLTVISNKLVYLFIFKWLVYAIIIAILTVILRIRYEKK